MQIVRNTDQASKTQKPGMFATYKDGALVALVLLTSLGIVLLAIIFAIAHPNFTARVIFGGGIVGISALMCREFWLGNRMSKVWGVSLLLLAVALAGVSIASSVGVAG